MLACVLPLAIFFIYLLTKPSMVRFSALNALSLILISGFIFTFTEHLLFIFLSFELLLLSSLYLLRLTAKSERIGEAVTEMFFWTLAGSLFLFLGFMLFFIEGYLTLSQIVFADKAFGLASFMFIFGFGVKLPI
jgi:NADH:ubiquinone oxidoreductase subunit 2 (subunit N)